MKTAGTTGVKRANKRVDWMGDEGKAHSRIQERPRRRKSEMWEGLMAPGMAMVNWL